MDDARQALTPPALDRLGLKPVRPVSGGYTLMERWIVGLPGGGTAFAKLAVGEATAGFLRDEHRIYSHVSAPFLPRLLGWDDDGELPLLLLEDLSAAHWPPPWREGDVAAVLRALEEVNATPPPPGLPSLAPEDLHSWHDVEADPEPFLALGLCSAGWLEAALPELLAATARVRLDGDTLVHLDVRSDNICLRDGRAVLIDWNWARTGNPAIDIAFWLPTLCIEGGPGPEEVLPDGADLAAVVSGFFAPIAGLVPPTGAPTVRALQLAQLETALRWAVDALGLAPLDR